MVFNVNIFIGLVIILGLWSLGLSIAVFRMVNHYNKLIGGSTAKTLREVLDGLLIKQARSEEMIGSLQTSIEKLTNDGQLHFQRLGIVRFNPFADTGGNQSFTLALLDGGNNGVIMTSLYARMGNRWYVKMVRAGVGENVELSKEERQAILSAKPVALVSKTRKE